MEEKKGMRKRNREGMGGGGEGEGEGEEEWGAEDEEIVEIRRIIWKDWESKKINWWDNSF